MSKKKLHHFIFAIAVKPSSILADKHLPQ